eukprot:scaffold50283_cov39-Attheya_sp.AAC.2
MSGDSRSKESPNVMLGGEENEVVDNQKNDHAVMSPFEWLTNFASVSHLMPHNPHPRRDDENEDLWKALHVGCGTSTLGEQLISELGYDRVVNVDCNEESLDFLRQRQSSQTTTTAGNQTFVTMDFCQRGENQNDAGAVGTGSFDLVVDKSTLDCALCSEHAATGLLFHSYRALRPNGGVYLLISFNHVDFIQPLLEGLPGAHWTTEHHIIRRQLDHHEVNAPTTTEHNVIHPSEKVTTTTATSTGATTNSQKEASTSAWSSGSFEPDAEYGRTVNVFVCRRHDDESGCELDWDAVRDHVFRTNDSWFKEHNPILTHVRRQDLRQLFTAALLETEGIVKNASDPFSDDAVLSLEKCYTILFTEAEKEQLSFDFFLEDWNEFYKTSGEDKSAHGMTFDTAVQFLNEMQ